ncbi:response regulator [Cohnella caldifontis]|uniref:response regulator n=1 Tax=Cohnella caldifontis TaxID=3027471 RepID=UPI0023ED00E8|nr:response regulator [Cohnella sp. YIM B05605]
MLRVWLVDDEVHALNLLEILLLEIGNIEVAGKSQNPVAAVEQIRAERVDAVFLDVDMPVMSGVEVAKALKLVRPELQIVFSTAYADFAIEAFEIRALDYILKPFKIDRVRNTVNWLQAAVTQHSVNTDPGAGTKISCLGGFSVHPGYPHGGRLSWRTNKVKELCAFLVHCRGQAVEHSVILEALWPDADVKKASGYLYACVSMLRKNLRQTGLESRIKLQKTNSGYALELENAACDADELQELLDETIGGEGLGERRLKQLAALYKGDYLGDCDYRWAAERREKLAAQYVQALRELIRHFRITGRHSFVMEGLQLLLAVSPDCEKDGRELIRFHLENGNRNEGIKVYRQLKHAVRERLDAELEDETVEVYRQLVSSGDRTRGIT